MEFFGNGKKILLLAQELNPKIPSFTGHALIRDVTDIKAFIGLESDSDALLKLSHSYFGAEVDDLFMQCDLRGGNSINTELKWRSNLMTDVQNSLKSLADYFGKIKSDKTWVDMEKILNRTEKSLLDISNELIVLTNLQITDIFNPILNFTNFLKSFNFGDETNSVVSYYLDGTEYAIKYR